MIDSGTIDMNEKKIEDIFKTLELPGEDEQRIKQWLEERQFSRKVINHLIRVKVKEQRLVFWILFLLLQLLVLALTGTNANALQTIYHFPKVLTQFFFLFLGLTCLGSILGLFLSADIRIPDSLDKFIHHPEGRA